MPRSPTPQGSLRQRNVPSKEAVDSTVVVPELELDKLSKAVAHRNVPKGELGHKLALSLVTILSFVTRFWGISHPNEVVFDEVHFGKVYRCANCILESMDGF